MRQLALCFIVLSIVQFCASAHAADDARAGIDAFNRALDTATRTMDNNATLALWEDDGVSLLPGRPPIAGKPALAKFLADVSTRLRAARMTTFELGCHGIETAGDWASEWCDEHQAITFADGKPAFDGRGRMLLVLHRGADGHWRLRREMWAPAEEIPR